MRGVEHPQCILSPCFLDGKINKMSPTYPHTSHSSKNHHGAMAPWRGAAPPRPPICRFTWVWPLYFLNTFFLALFKGFFWGVIWVPFYGRCCCELIGGTNDANLKCKGMDTTLERKKEENCIADKQLQ